MELSALARQTVREYGSLASRTSVSPKDVVEHLREIWPSAYWYEDEIRTFVVPYGDGELYRVVERISPNPDALRFSSLKTIVVGWYDDSGYLVSPPALSASLASAIANAVLSLELVA